LRRGCNRPRRCNSWLPRSSRHGTCGSAGDHVLAPHHRIGFTAVGSKNRGGSRAGPVVDHGGQIRAATVFESRGDSRRAKAGRRGDAHGLTPAALRAVVSSMPSARFIEWIAPPAVPFTKL